MEIIIRMLSKDPKLLMERDEIKVALAMKKAQERLIATMRENQSKMRDLQEQSDMGKLIRKEMAKPLRELLEDYKAFAEKASRSK